MTALPWIIACYALASLVTFGAFVFDKRAAETGARRVRERTLHVLEALGGFPGALAAMRLVRHKNRKWSFFLVTGAIALLHAAAWALWLLRGP